MSNAYWNGRYGMRPDENYTESDRVSHAYGAQDRRDDEASKAREKAELDKFLERIRSNPQDKTPSVSYDPSGSYSPVKEAVIRVCCIFALSCIAGGFVNKGELLVGSYTFVILMAIYGLLTLASRSARSQPAPRTVPVSRAEHDKRMAAITKGERPSAQATERKPVEYRKTEAKRHSNKRKK